MVVMSLKLMTEKKYIWFELQNIKSSISFFDSQSSFRCIRHQIHYILRKEEPPETPVEFFDGMVLI